MTTRQIGYKGVHRPASSLTWRAKMFAAVATLMLGLSLMAAPSAFAAAAPTLPSYLTDHLKACQSDQAQAVTLDEQAWAATCVTLAQRGINAWIAANPTPTPTPTLTSTPSASPTSSPTASPTRTATPTPTVGPVDPYPSASNGVAGVPAGWVPSSTRTTELRVTTAGAVIENIRIVKANLIVDAPNVTIRNVELVGGRIDNWPGTSCRNGMILDHVSILRAPGQVTTDDGTPAVGTGGYTARYVKIVGLPEGFRVGGVGAPALCGPVVIDHSYTDIVAPDVCNDWHGDGIQGYGGPPVTVTHSTLWLHERPGCGGTAPFFYPSGQGNTRATINGLIVKGGGFSFRDGMPGSVAGLKIVDDLSLYPDHLWGYGPIDVKCSAITAWQADIVTLDAAGQPTTVRAQPCNSNGGS